MHYQTENRDPVAKMPGWEMVMDVNENTNIVMSAKTQMALIILVTSTVFGAGGWVTSVWTVVRTLPERFDSLEKKTDRLNQRVGADMETLRVRMDRLEKTNADMCRAIQFIGAKNHVFIGCDR